MMGPHEAVQRIAHTSERTSLGTVYKLDDPRYPEYAGRQVICHQAYGVCAWGWTTHPLPPRRFQVGDQVTAAGFSDDSGERQEDRSGLVVTECRTIEGYAPHHRVKAERPNSFYCVEGAERFFELETASVGAGRG